MTQNSTRSRPRSEMGQGPETRPITKAIDRLAVSLGPLLHYAKPAMNAARRVAGYIAQQQDVRFVAHTAFLLLAVMLIRPLFLASVPWPSYEAESIIWQLLVNDVSALWTANRSQGPVVPRLLFVLVPTLVFLIARHRVTWERWEVSRSLKILVMTIVAVMTWASATFDFNTYFDQAHFVDRAALIGFAVLSWRTPLAVPFVALLSLILMAEASIPLGHDHFDYRPLIEFLAMFSCFVWLSPLRSLNTRHLIFCAICLFASYYYEGGIAKYSFGPDHSWTLENSLSNLLISSYLHGWLGFLPESIITAATGFFQKLDWLSTAFTLVVELGAIILVNVHLRVTRFWLLGAAILHGGIFAFSGIFFWKWIIADLAFWHFLRGSGGEMYGKVQRRIPILAWGIAVIFFASQVRYFMPQMGVAWYDTPLNELYRLYAISDTGKRYLVNPADFAPADTRMIQEDFAFLTKERTLTRTYGTSYDYLAHDGLKKVKTKEDFTKLLNRRGRSAYSARWTRTFDTIVSRYFKNRNQNGLRHRWLSWLGRPRHLWTHVPNADYDDQEPVRKVEVWRERVFYDGEKLHRWGSTKLHEVQIAD